MSKPVSEWDAAYIFSLPKENNEIERKGSKKLDLTAGAEENDVLTELAKQLSAFANTGGGKIIYGLKNDGSVDNGGISTAVKSGGTKEWLERQIAVLTDYEILGVTVHEFEPKMTASEIQKGKALYVVDVPNSDRAPHQSKKDLRYYVRLGSQSLPAPHRLIEDIRNRQKHPNVSLRLELADLSLKQEGSDRSLFAANVTLRVVLVNEGNLKSADTFLVLKPQVGAFLYSFDHGIAEQLLGIEPGCYGWELARPLAPKSEIRFRASYHFGARYNESPAYKAWWDQKGQVFLGDLSLDWTIFADSAPPRTGTFTLKEIGVHDQLRERAREQFGTR